MKHYQSCEELMKISELKFKDILPLSQPNIKGVTNYGSKIKNEFNSLYQH
jgi:hypothetical protein